MNIEEMLKNIKPSDLSKAISRMSNFLSPQQMEQITNAINSSDKSDLNQKLNNLTPDTLKRELSQNPALAEQLANNPEVMAKINQIFKK